ncbi:MAG TPA: tetratricopeptide repeat protein [Pyrinomonadaceae bacterium]|nr:tetratricopeptide repeat protein [Pyrinomonadaceae bacterium]
MNSRQAAASTALLFIFLFCYGAEAAAQENSIRGKVHNAAGVNVSQATVILERNGALIDQTVTNNEGDFFFSGLGETSYVITVSVPDYNPVAERVEFVRRVSANQPGETRTVEITLLPQLTARTPRAATAFVQNVPPAARNALERALKLSKQAKLDLAQALMREALKLFPDYFDARFALGNELMRAGRLGEAIIELEQARRINPKDERVYEVFGLILMQQKKYAVAAAVFAEASRLSPADPQIQLLRAIALIEQASIIIISASPTQNSIAERDYALSEAENSLARAFDLSGHKLTAVYLQRARIYEKKGERARAADELEQYLRETPNANNLEAIRAAIKKLRELAGRS